LHKQAQYNILSSLYILLVVLAAVTVLPYSGSRPNLLGYRSICGFVPLSTLILLGAAIFARLLRDPNYRAPTAPGASPSVSKKLKL
jgi:hypothetical protein